MFKFPKNFPALKKPYLIIATPIWFQIFLLLLLFLVSASGIVWVLIYVDRLHFIHFFVFLISFWLLYGVFSKATWGRWFDFAADINGVYVGNKNSLLIFIPWENVGDTYVVSSENFGTNVIIKIKIDEYSWNKMPDEGSAKTTRPSVYLEVDKDGYRQIAIGNYILSTRYKLRKIALLRNQQDSGNNTK